MKQVRPKGRKYHSWKIGHSRVNLIGLGFFMPGPQRMESVMKLKVCFLAMMVGACLFLAFLFPELIINIIVGNRYIAATPLLKYMVLAMAFLSFSALIVFYNLSIDYHKKITARILGSALFLQVALLILFHANLEQFIKVILGINIVLFLALLTTLKR